LAALAAAVDIAEAALRTALAASVVSLVFCSSAQSQPRLRGSVLGSGEFGLPLDLLTNLELCSLTNLELCSLTNLELFEKSSLEAGTGVPTTTLAGRPSMR
jgi:hypothetical protein